jgi:hypothetical protein
MFQQIHINTNTLQGTQKNSLSNLKESIHQLNKNRLWSKLFTLHSLQYLVVALGIYSHRFLKIKNF